MKECRKMTRWTKRQKDRTYSGTREWGHSTPQRHCNKRFSLLPGGSPSYKDKSPEFVLPSLV